MQRLRFLDQCWGWCFLSASNECRVFFYWKRLFSRLLPWTVVSSEVSLVNLISSGRFPKTCGTWWSKWLERRTRSRKCELIHDLFLEQNKQCKCSTINLRTTVQSFQCLCLSMALAADWLRKHRLPEVLALDKCQAKRCQCSWQGSTWIRLCRGWWSSQIDPLFLPVFSEAVLLRRASFSLIVLLTVDCWLYRLKVKTVRCWVERIVLETLSNCPTFTALTFQASAFL